MKTRNISFITMTLVFVSQLIFANDDKYTQAMQKNITAIYNAKSNEEAQPIINTFERIAAAEKTKWEPHYYAAFGYVMMANREKEPTKKDSYLDLAIASIEKAKA